MSSTPTTAPRRSTLVSVLAWLMIVGSGIGLLVATLQNILFMTVLPADTFAPLAKEGKPPLPPVAMIALLVLGVVGNLAGVMIQQSMMSMMIPPPDAPPEFADMFTRMAAMVRTAALVFSVGFSALFIWLITRLMSAPIKAEFGAAQH